MPIGIGSGLWGVVLPIAETNLAQNPSFEFGATGVVAIQGATIGSTSQFQRYGVWSLKVTPGANGTSGALLGTYAVAAGTTYSVSVWAFVEQGVPMRIGVGDQNGLNLQNAGTATFTGGGTWQWYPVPALAEAAPSTRGVVLQKASGVSQLPYYVDGLKISPWTDSIDRVTTYFDGDTGGGTWTGAEQASTSTRSGQYRGGGSIIALADIGLQVDQMVGAGVPSIEVSTQSFAVTDGAQFQRQRTAQRKFTLTAKPISGTSLADFHVTRRTLFDAFKPDIVSEQQPVRLLYYGAQGTQFIDAYYDKGLELGNMDGVIAENAAVSFIAPDPYWYAPVQQGTTLAPRTAMGSVNYLAKRTSLGQWGTLGANGTTIGYSLGGQRIYAIAPNGAGSIYIGGNFGTLGGTLSPQIGMYFPSTNRFGTLTGGTLAHADGGVLTFAQNPNGTLFFGGQFTTVAGTTANHVGQWTGAFGTLTGGTLSPGAGGQVNKLLFTPTGTLAMAGIFGTAGGIARAGNIAFWTGAFGTLGRGGVGTLGGESVNALAWGLDGVTLYIGGGFTNVGGTIGTAIGFFKNGSFGTMGGVFSGGNQGLINSFAVGPNGLLYEAGLMDRINSGTFNTIAQWNGVQHQQLGNGVNSLSRSVIIDPATSNVLVAGSFTQAGSINVASNYAIWNGASWLLPDISVGPSIYTLAYSPDNTLYIGGDFTGTAYSASVVPLVNVGRAAAYPSLRLRNRSAAGTARLYQILNTTTGNGIYFNYVMLPGEQADLVLQPSARSFVSTSRGNIFGVIIPGSNLATFNMLSGTNYISFFADNDSLEASFFWTPRGWAADSGTAF